jgi:hypothetical protein
MSCAFTNFVYFTILPGINTASGILPVNISYIKRRRTRKNELLYLLKAWVKDIEPPIHSKYFPSNESKM